MTTRLITVAICAVLASCGASDFDEGRTAFDPAQADMTGTYAGDWHNADDPEVNGTLTLAVVHGENPEGLRHRFAMQLTVEREGFDPASWEFDLELDGVKIAGQSVASADQIGIDAEWWSQDEMRGTITVWDRTAPVPTMQFVDFRVLAADGGAPSFSITDPGSGVVLQAW